MASENATGTTQHTLSVADAKALKKLPQMQELIAAGKLYEPKENGKYYGPVLLATKDSLFQQVGESTFVKHSRAAMASWPFETDTPRSAEKFRGTVLDVNYDGAKATPAIGNPERWMEREARTPATELVAAIAKSHLGQNVGVYNAPSELMGMSTRYEGVVVAVHQNSVIQRINSRTAIVHEVSPEVAQKLGAGQQVAVQYEKGVISQVSEIDRTQSKARGRADESDNGKSAGRNVDPETAKRNSFFFARNIVRDGYGTDVKIYDAMKVSPEGQFKGTVVAVTDHHVMQRVGAKSFIAHERSNLDNEVKRGALVELTYKDGRANAVEMERRRDRQQSQERAAPQRSAPQHSKGMDR